MEAGAACGAKEVEAGFVEVERKLFLTEAQREALRTTLPLRTVRKFWDVYYDGPRYPLGSRDWWLRQRGEDWELKVPWAPGQAMAAAQSYEEVLGSAAVAARLSAEGLLGAEEAGVAGGASGLEELLEAASIRPFARLHTERASLEAGPAALEACGAQRLQVDLDTVTYDAGLAEPGAALLDGGPPFLIAEVEIVAARCQEAVDAASASLEAFLAWQGLDGAPKAHSKLLEYLLHLRPSHLDALSQAGTLPPGALQKLRASAASRAAT